MHTHLHSARRAYLHRRPSPRKPPLGMRRVFLLRDCLVRRISVENLRRRTNGKMACNSPRFSTPRPRQFRFRAIARTIPKTTFGRTRSP